jgi:hypothetical protein
MGVTQERRRRVADMMNRLSAYQTIQNEMGRVVVAFNFRQPAKILERFALDRDDVSVEFADEGVFTGRAAVTAIVEAVAGGTPRAGEMLDMQLTTPIVEIAGDGGSARALWWCPGAGAIVPEEGDPQAIWAWGMVAVDFVRVDGAWKILNLHYFRYIKCAYEQGWVEDTSMINRLQAPMHPLAAPGTYHNPYSPLTIRDGIPAAPRPYVTYDGPQWALQKDKTR